jgi:flagellar hook-associated protein 3 FlgL
MMAASSENPDMIQVTTSDARSHFSSIVSVINTKIGNRSLFAGTNTSTNALISVDEIINSIKISISAETTASGIETAVSSWFDDPGGSFETIAYQGSENLVTTFRLSPNDTKSLELRADSQGFKNLLKGFTLATLVADGVLLSNPTEQIEMTKSAASYLLNSENSITEMRSYVGTIQSYIENANTRNITEISAIEIARSSILSVDPYDSATKLQSMQTQLELLYAMTAKLSKLSLVNYI